MLFADAIGLHVIDGTGRRWPLDDQASLERMVGKQVRVSGVCSEAGILHVVECTEVRRVLTTRFR